ncbi:MAG: hypothetical protein QW075_00795 [Thermofilaceae archaeon]
MKIAYLLKNDVFLLVKSTPPFFASGKPRRKVKRVASRVTLEEAGTGEHKFGIDASPLLAFQGFCSLGSTRMDLTEAGGLG